MKVFCVYEYDFYEGSYSPVKAVFDNEELANGYARRLQSVHDKDSCGYLTYKVQQAEFVTNKIE